jgi:formate hydrogenlyase transcriptional activator
VESVSARNDEPDSRECVERLQFETLLGELSARFVNVPADQVDAEIENAQRRICDCLGLDLCSLWQRESESPGSLVLTHHYRRLDGPSIPTGMRGDEHFPWALGELLAGRRVVISSLDEAPKGIEPDLAAWQQFGLRDALCFPLSAGGGVPFGALSFHDLVTARTWSEPVIQRLELVTEVFANALARRRFEQVLRESEELSRASFEQAAMGLAHVGFDGHFLRVNDRLCAIVGYSREELLKLTFQDITHPEDLDKDLSQVHRVLSGEVSNYAMEKRYFRKDRSIVWINLTVSLIRRASGEPIHFFSVIEDITGQKVVAQKLKETLDEVQRLRDRLQKENVYLRDQMRVESGHGAIVGESEPVHRMLALIEKVAPTDSAVLITGETGTGKELLAQAIHDLSSRKAKTMVKVNCAALPAPLIESELFGREKGAYTGAMTQQVGRFEIANGSTIFLDEIGDLPLDLQVKLLRVLQDGQYERLGSNRSFKADARVIAATNRDLATMVREGRFREDLFHRLNVFPIEVPPLRSRITDIPLLAWTFVQEFNTKMGRSIESVPKLSMERLKECPWPGNVRELRNVIERAMIVSEGRSLRIDLPQGSSSSASQPSTLEAVERQHILAVLAHTHWRISGKGGAAEVLALVPTTLHSRMKKLGISRPDRNGA